MLILLRILLSMVALLALRGEPGSARRAADYAQRYALAGAIALATSDPVRQIVLARTARFESGFDPRVGRCERKGPQGELGFFQLKPIARGDAKLACGSALEQARLADAYMTRGAEACPANVGADSLAMYVSGTCARGIPEAKHRWGTPEAPDLGIDLPSPEEPALGPEPAEPTASAP